MGWVFQRPSITALEVLWRWVFGVPFLLVCWTRLHFILTALSLRASGLSEINGQNPWIVAAQLSDGLARYKPFVASELYWLAPIAAMIWIVVSNVSRNLVLRRIEPGVRFRPTVMVILQGVWLALFWAVCWAWFRSIS